MASISIRLQSRDIIQMTTQIATFGQSVFILALLAFCTIVTQTSCQIHTWHSQIVCLVWMHFPFCLIHCILLSLLALFLDLRPIFGHSQSAQDHFNIPYNIQNIKLLIQDFFFKVYYTVMFCALSPTCIRSYTVGANSSSKCHCNYAIDFDGLQSYVKHCVWAAQ